MEVFFHSLSCELNLNGNRKTNWFFPLLKKWNSFKSTTQNECLNDDFVENGKYLKHKKKTFPHVYERFKIVWNRERSEKRKWSMCAVQKPIIIANICITISFSHFSQGAMSMYLSLRLMHPKHQKMWFY